MTWRLSRLTRPLRGDQFGLDWPSSLPWTSRSVWRGPGDQFAVDSVSSLVWETQKRKVLVLLRIDKCPNSVENYVMNSRVLRFTLTVEQNVSQCAMLRHLTLSTYELTM